MATVEPSPSTQTIGTNGSASSDNNPENVHEKVARMASLKQHSPLFLFFEEPHSGPLAQHFANIMTIVVVVSIIAFCLETENALKENCDYICWFVIDWIFVIVFTVEFGIRQFLYIKEGKCKEFWADAMNVIDFIAILPSYIELVQWISLDYPQYGPPEELFLKLMKLAKCTRVFKLMKHFPGTEVLVKSIEEAMEALAIPFFFLAIFVLLFASIMFFIEGQKGTFNELDGHWYDSGGDGMVYKNIPSTMYFMMVTMTTTGYGDQYPATTLGKIIAAFSAVFGILFLAMPLTIVGNAFYNNWNKFLAKKEREKATRDMLLRRKEFKRKSMLQSDLRRNVEKIMVQNSDPGPPSRKMDGTQRDILGAYLTLMHLVSSFRISLSEILTDKLKTDKEKEEQINKQKIGTTGGTGVTGADAGADATASSGSTPAPLVVVDDEEQKYQDQFSQDKRDNETRLKLKHLKDLMLDISVNSAVFGSVLSKGTKTKGRKGSKRLLKDIGRRILVQVKMRKWASLYGRSDDIAKNADIAEQHKRGWKDSLYLLLEFPETSLAAKRISQFSIVVIMLSIFSFCAESCPDFHTYGGSEGIDESGWFAIETVFTVLFTVEFVLRLVVAPRRWTFWTDTLNWCDLVAIVPFYFEVLLALSAGTEPWNFNVADENIKLALRVVKLFRVLRVFKMTRQFPSAGLIADTFSFSLDALMVPMFFLLVFVLIFASMLYFLEPGKWIDGNGTSCEYYCEGGTYIYEIDGSENPNVSIFSCFWLMIITITTVGYGDISPNTLPGKLVAILAMIFGIIYTAMPLAIVGSFFFDAYDKQKKAMQTPSDLAKAIRTKIPKSAEPAIDFYIDGSPESENLSAKQIVSKLKDDLCILCGEEVKKKKSMFGGIFSSGVGGLNSGSGGMYGALKKAAKEDEAKKEIKTEDNNDETTLHPLNQTGDVLNGGSRYSAPTPIKSTENGDTAKKAVPKINILPLVVKRMIRRLEYHQRQLLQLGRVVHYMIAEKGDGEDIVQEEGSLIAHHG